jgi:hypothetical protein
MTIHALSQRRACELIGITRRGFQRAPAPDRNLQLRQRLRELAEQRRRCEIGVAPLMLTSLSEVIDDLLQRKTQDAGRLTVRKVSSYWLKL